MTDMDIRTRTDVATAATSPGIASVGFESHVCHE